MPITVEPSRLITTGQAATLLGVSDTRVWQLVGAGLMTPTLKTRYADLFDSDDVKRLAAARAQRDVTSRRATGE